MAVCANCGAALTATARFCPSCGTAAASATPPGRPTAADHRESRRTGSILRAAVGRRAADHGPLPMRIGVTTGEVVAGDPGTGQTFVTGDPVNTAARLQAAAAPGTVVIDEATQRRISAAAPHDAPPP